MGEVNKIRSRKQFFHLRIEYAGVGFGVSRNSYLFYGLFNFSVAQGAIASAVELLNTPRAGLDSKFKELIASVGDR